MLQGKQLSPTWQSVACIQLPACLPARRTCDSVRLMFLRFLRAAKVRLDTSSLLLEASGVSTKPTMKGAMPLALLQQQQPGNTATQLSTRHINQQASGYASSAVLAVWLGPLSSRHRCHYTYNLPQLPAWAGAPLPTSRTC